VNFKRGNFKSEFELQRPWDRSVFVASSSKLAGITVIFLLVLVPVGCLNDRAFTPSPFRVQSPAPALLSPIDPPVTILQNFDGPLNQSLVFAKNQSLVPYRVDADLTGLNQTADRLTNGNFASGLNGWQVPSMPGRNFSWNQTGPAGATSLQANVTGLWNSSFDYPLNDTTHIDQFDDPTLWSFFNGPSGNITADINAGDTGTSGNYLNISW
jgi:hypothetical protein